MSAFPVFLHVAALIFRQHWIRLELHAGVLIERLWMTVDPADSSYMPSLIVVSGGPCLTWMSELRTIHVESTDSQITLLSDMREYYRFIEIGIRECRSFGIDCKVHGLSILGRPRGEDEDCSPTFPYLASDWEDTDDTALGTQSQSQRTARPSENFKDFQTKVFVWGLNDKDQLGGLKGSKVGAALLAQGCDTRFLRGLGFLHCLGTQKRGKFF